MGVGCLYVIGKVGFWVSAPPTPTVIWYPPRFAALRGYFLPIFNRFWPGVDVVPLSNCGGSGDPFLKILLAGLPPWQKLVAERFPPPD